MAPARKMHISSLKEFRLQVRSKAYLELEKGLSFINENQN